MNWPASIFAALVVFAASTGVGVMWGMAAQWVALPLLILFGMTLARWTS